jgi:type I restriction enzyme S subunit
MAGDWETRRIGDLGRVVTGKTPSTAVAENFGGNYPFITIPDMDGRREISSSARTLSEQGAQSLKTCRLPARAVMMSCIATIGNCGITTRPSFTNQQINSLICGDDADPKFVYYSFTQLGHALEAAGGGGSVYTNVSKSRFEEIELTLPPLAEQKAIAAVLGALDDKIELNRRMNATLEAMARALFQSWFIDFDPVRQNMDRNRPSPQPSPTGRGRSAAEGEGAAGLLDARQPTGLNPATAALFPASFQESEVGHIPHGWKATTLGACIGFRSGFSFKSQDWRESGVPVVKIGSVKPGIIDLTQVSYVSEEIAQQAARYRLTTGDMLIGMTGYVGEVGLVPPSDNPPLLNQRVGKFVMQKPGTESLAFWYCATRQPEFRAFVEARSHGTAQANVSGEAIMEFPLVSPSLEILEAFNRECQPMLDRILSNHAESRTLATLRDTLLPKLLSGELSVAGIPAMENTIAP